MLKWNKQGDHVKGKKYFFLTATESLAVRFFIYFYTILPSIG